MKKKIFIVLIVLIMALASLFFVSNKSVLAKKDTQKCEKTNTGKFEWEVSYPFEGPTSEKIPDYIEYIYRIAFFAGAALAVLMIIIGGIQWSAAGLSPSAKNEAKDKITKSIMGVLLLIGSYAMLNTINPDLVILKEPVLECEKEAELGADTVKTVQGADQCEGNNDTDKSVDMQDGPLCGDYCHYFCTGKIYGDFDGENNFPPGYFDVSKKRTTLGLEDDLGYMVAVDPGAGKDVVWCGCYALPEAVEEAKKERIDVSLKEQKVDSFEKLDNKAKKEIERLFGFTHLGTYAKGQPCEFLPDGIESLPSDEPLSSIGAGTPCGNFCHTECRARFGGGEIIGVISSSNAGAGTDTTWCSCFKGPAWDNKENPWHGFMGEEVDTFHPSGEPCESAGDAYPKCGNYCYKYCQDKGYKFGTVSGGAWGAGTDSVLCTCIK